LLHHVPFRLPEREFHALRHKQRTPNRIAEDLLGIVAQQTKSRSRSARRRSD
jgi:hypothetical protein